MEMQQLKQKIKKENKSIKEMPIDELVRKIQKDPEAMRQARELIATC